MNVNQSLIYLNWLILLLYQSKKIILTYRVKFENLIKNKTKVEDIEGDQPHDLKMSKETGGSMTVQVEITSSSGEKRQEPNNICKTIAIYFIDLDQYYSKLKNVERTVSDGQITIPASNNDLGSETEDDEEEEEEFIAA